MFFIPLTSIKVYCLAQSQELEFQHEKAAKLRDKPSFKKLWQFGKSNSSSASTSAAPALDVEARHQTQLPQSPAPDNKQHFEEITAEVQFVETRCEEGECMRPAEEASPTSKVDSTSARMAAAAAAAAIARPTVISPTTWSARSKEDIAATRIQAACRGHLVYVFTSIICFPSICCL